MLLDPGRQVLPKWLPQSVARYVAHTEQGISIRELARRDGCHASTVLRQIRKLEALRDDPLVDDALNKFRQQNKEVQVGPSLLTDGAAANMPREEVLHQEGGRVLRRLCETGAVLAVAADMENAVVVRDETTRTAVVDRKIAQAMALKDWISCVQVGRVSRYVITPAGRTAVRRMIAEEENQAQGFAESQAAFGMPDKVIGGGRMRAQQLVQRARFSTAESPLAILARRRDKDGKRFLNEKMVAAGERLREDFELAQMSVTPSPSWEKFLRRPGHNDYEGDAAVSAGQEAARQRVVAALNELGDGLSDVALRCCCFLEGLESAEKKMGWSARSGKVVLRIALGRLQRHYAANAGGSGDYIG